MIVSLNGSQRIEGDGAEIIAETTCLLHSVYKILVDEFGEEFANEKLVMMGKLAVMDIDEIKEWGKM